MSQINHTKTHSTQPNQTIPTYIRYIFGGGAGMMATCFTEPFDSLRNRIQLSGEGGKAKEHKTSLHAMRTVIKNQGIRVLYSGLSAGLIRQASFVTYRLGVYSTLLEKFSTDSGKAPGFLTKICIGMTAGAVGAICGTPTELYLSLITSGQLALADFRGYKYVFKELIRIARQEGVLILWRGCITGASQLAAYSQAKQVLLSTQYIKDNILCHFVASLTSGVVTTCASMPIVLAITRVQNMKIIDGKTKYKGAIDVIARVVRNEGLFALWKGFNPFLVRVVPHTVLMFMFLEQANQTYKHYVLKDYSVDRGL